MSTFYLVADWVTLLYFCLSTMFAAIILLFFAGKKPGLMRFAAINWGISNIANAGWDFVSDQVLQRDVVCYHIEEDRKRRCCNCPNSFEATIYGR